MGLIGLASPILWHSSRSGHAMGNFTLYQQWLMGTRFRNWYTADWDYGLATIYFFCAAIFVFAIAKILPSFRTRGNGARSAARATSTHSASLGDRVTALLRYLSSRQFYVSTFEWYSPPLGSMLIVGAMIVFFTVLTFAVHPYYWPIPEMGNSPPLATRTGWISIAIMPFMFAFSTKVNLVGILTGTPHEKLQVFHRWTAWIMYFTSLVHTFPFIRFNAGIGKMELYYQTKSYYWTGVAALVPQTWLVLMSWGPIRSRYYETFKKLHFLVSMIFMIFLFIHCNFRLTSWDYFWATGAVYGVTWLTRLLLTLLRNSPPRTATLEVLPDRTIRIRASIPSNRKLPWRPGQHFFVRFLGLGMHTFSSHPLTVASAPGSGVAEFYMRVRKGVTARLASVARVQGREIAMVLDGPYGVHCELGVYDRVLLLAGGSGVSFTVPLLFDLLLGLREKKIKAKHIHFVWAVQSPESLTCYDDLFNDAMAEWEQTTVSISLYTTGASSEASGKDDVDNLKESTNNLQTFNGRPNLPDIIRREYKAGGTLGIAVCGPDSFTLDVRNAVAESELDILRGNAGSTDLFLHTEAYSW